MGRRYRGSKKANDIASGVITMLIMIFLPIVGIAYLWQSKNGKVFLFSVIGLFLMWACFKVARSIKAAKLAELVNKGLMEKISIAAISDNRSDYHIGADDYKRGNPKENLYRKTFSLTLLRIFSNQCAKCKRSDNGVDIDHFVLSKNEGGCFILRHKEGHLVNNAVPLCQSCNRSKSDTNYKIFYRPDELAEIFQKNTELTKMLNENPILDRDGNVIKKKKSDKVAA